MKTKTINAEKCLVEFETTKSDLVKVSVFENFGFGREEPTWTFFLPKTTRSQHGFVPVEIVKARMLHDFNVKLGHYSICNKI